MEESKEKPEKKVSKSETGHQKNAANFTALIESVKNYGTRYNPSNAEISLASLESLNARIDAAMSGVSKTDAAHKNAVRERQDAYEGMSALTTRIQNSFASCATKHETANAKSYTKKIRGSKKKKTIDVTDEKTKSTSQMSFDNKMKNLKDFCVFLGTIPAYRPNETELQPASVLTYVDSLSLMNGAVNGTWDKLNIARAERDRVMYGEESGLTDIVKNVKSYVTSVYGTTSPEFKRISGIRFVKNSTRKRNNAFIPLYGLT